MDSFEYERRLTKAEKRAMSQLINELDRDDIALSIDAKLKRLVPPGWQLIDRKAPVQPKKTKITIRLDEDLAKWFRHLGRGYQGRINAVLRAYMLAALSKYAEETDDTDWRGLPIY